MTSKLVVFINSLKVPKIKKILLYEMKFLVPIYSCLQLPWLGGYCPQIPILSVLCPQLNLLNPPPPKKIPGYATGVHLTENAETIVTMASKGVTHITGLNLTKALTHVILYQGDYTS